MSTSPNMGLTIPTPSVTLGPEWASDISDDFDIVDAHDHSSGKGPRVPASGLDINADLPFGGNSPTGMASAQFSDQTTEITTLTDTLYFLNGDLYVLDGNGNSVRITENGALSAAGTGTIAGLPSGTASAAFAASTFTFRSSTNRYATMAGGPVKLRRADEDNPNGITLQPAAATATQTLTFPAALPAATQFMTMDASGGIGYTPALSQGITRAMQAAVGQQVSSSTGAFTGTSGTPGETITNATVTLTTTGRPVVIMLVPDGSGNSASVRLRSTSGAGSINLWVAVSGSATDTIGLISLSTGTTAASPDWAMWPPSALSTVYVPAAGTYTFTAKIQLNGSVTTYAAIYCKLIAWEL